MVRKPNDKNTKAEILAAYEELLKENKTLQTQAKAAATVVTYPVSTPEPPKPMTPPTLNSQKVENIIDNLGKLQLGFGGAVSDLSEKLTTEATKLGEIQKLVTEELKQLQELHDLEVTDTTFATLIQTYEENAKTFESEFAQRREALEISISDQKKAWLKEQEDYQRTLKERNENQLKTLQRDTEEYQYNLDLQRNLNIEEYEQGKKVLYQQLDERKEQQQKAWEEREKALAEREKEFADAKAKVEAMPQEKDAAIKKAKEEGRGIAAYQARVKADLYAKEVEGQKQYYELRLQSLSETIQTQESRIQNLSKQLDAALKQVQDLAVKAIEGASNLSSSQVLKEIALEQAKQLKTK